MTHHPKFLVPVLAFILTAVLLSACAAPNDPSPVPTLGADSDGSDPPSENTQDESTEELLEEVTNFPVLTEAEKSVQRVYHNEFDSENLYVLPWDVAGTARECPYTSEEILSAVSLGDNIMDVYSRIGYPTYRDTPDTFLSGRPLDLFTMDYTTADGDVIFIYYRLAGCTEEDYRYVVTALDSAQDKIPYTSMDFDTKTRLQVIPVFMAVEQVGVDYLLEKKLITPYEATLYAAEETVYQEWLADRTTAE